VEYNKNLFYQAVLTLAAGGIIAYPTEAVIGLGCDPQNEKAIKKLLIIKKRSIEKGFILIAANIEQLTPYIHTLDEQTRNRILPSWPGPTTWLLPARPNVSRLLRGEHDTIAVRITNHPLAKKLCEQWGNALISTSANISEQPAVHNIEIVKTIFSGQVNYYMNGDVGALAQPTEIKDGQTGKIIRQ